MRLRCAVGQRGRDVVAVKGEGLRVVNVPAVEADQLRRGVGVYGVLPVDITADIVLEHVGGIRCAVAADDGFALLQPDLVAALVKNDVKQVRVGGAVFPGDLGENAEVLVLRRFFFLHGFFFLRRRLFLCGFFLNRLLHLRLFLCRFLRGRLLAGRKGHQHHKPQKQGDESRLFLHKQSPLSE